MDLGLSEEQVLIKDSLQRFMQSNYSLRQRADNAASTKGFSAEVWQLFAELGWLGIPFAEEFGGFGGSIIDVALVMEQIGAGLVVEPYLATVLLAGRMLALCPGDAQLQWLPGIIDGTVQGALAFHEPQSRFDLHDIKTSATPCNDGYLISGAKSVVFNGGAADVVIVSARVTGEQRDAESIALFALDTKTAGVRRTVYQLMDGQQVADYAFDGVTVTAGQCISLDGAMLLAKILDEASIGICAEALGIMQQLYQKTVAYANTRVQFGQPIGRFQALQHRMVDMYVACEQSRSMLLRALCACNEHSADLAREIAAMKAYVAKSAQRIGEEAIQLHGGMGLTEELDIGHYVRRLLMINVSFGDADHHRRRFCELSYAPAPNREHAHV
jgi:alkylation response protein AidB-like acyl-CoA dehydrogenase